MAMRRATSNSSSRRPQMSMKIRTEENGPPCSGCTTKLSMRPSAVGMSTNLSIMDRAPSASKQARQPDRKRRPQEHQQHDRDAEIEIRHHRPDDLAHGD